MKNNRHNFITPWPVMGASQEGYEIGKNVPARVLGIFAHPDDEVFCAGGTLARFAAEGAEIMVVSATRGEAGQIRDAHLATRQTLGNVREQELYRSCERLGVQHVLCLDYGDGALGEVDSQALAEHLARLIRNFRPNVIITFGPDGGYGHPDHIAISNITTRAFRLAGDIAQFPKQLVNGLLPRNPTQLYYSYFPRRRRLLSERLVRWLVGLNSRFQGSVDFAHALLLFAEEATMLGYTNDHIELGWFPAGCSIVEQGEAATKLYLILSGWADVIRENDQGDQTVLAQIGPGCFFGEDGLAFQQPRNAYVVAVDNMTCLVFSPQTPTKFTGRGAGARLATSSANGSDHHQATSKTTTCLDVSQFVEQKVAAMAAHRTQFRLEPDMFPVEILRELFGREYFVRVEPFQGMGMILETETRGQWAIP